MNENEKKMYDGIWQLYVPGAPPPPPPAPPKVTVKYVDEWFPIYDFLAGVIAFALAFGIGFVIGRLT